MANPPTRAPRIVVERKRTAAGANASPAASRAERRVTFQRDIASMTFILRPDSDHGDGLGIPPPFMRNHRRQNLELRDGLDVVADELLDNGWNGIHMYREMDRLPPLRGSRNRGIQPR